MQYILPKKEQSLSTCIGFKFGRVYELTLEDGSINAIFSSDVIEHLEDILQFLCELKRVAKNAIIVMSTPVRVTEILMDIEHDDEWFSNEYMRLIENLFYASHPIALL